jgi:hypothetical protein
MMFAFLLLMLSVVERDGPLSGRELFNQGNAYLRNGDNGRAVLSYRRAQRLLGNELRLEYNLSLARGRVGGMAQSEQSDLTLFAVCWAGFWLALTWWRRRRALILLGAACLVTGGVAAWRAYEHATAVDGVVIDAGVPARLGPGESYSRAWAQDVVPGSEFRVVEKRWNWYQIELPDGRRCWIRSESAELV